MKITVDYSRDELFDSASLKTLKDRYLKTGEESPQDAFARVSRTYADDEAHGQRLYDYASKHWICYSTPVLANAGDEKTNAISCFLNGPEDTISSITGHYTETVFMTVSGGGVGGYWSRLRTGGKSTGMPPFLKVTDSLMAAASQSVTRRGSYAAWLEVSHPDIMEFIHIRDASSGDLSRRCLGLGFHHGVAIPDTFMESVIDDKDWNLIDPHTKEVKETLKARYIWQKILEMRVKSGEPYIMFLDNVNKDIPVPLASRGAKIVQSNLCSEITLLTGKDYLGNERSAVCCLSHLNLSKFNEYENQLDQVVEDLARLLDNVLTKFIENNLDGPLHKAAYGVSRTRDIGAGALGFHDWLQKNDIAIESREARDENMHIFTKYHDAMHKASVKLANERGPYPDAIVDGNIVDNRRFAFSIAIAPNASTSIIAGNTSPGIEPYAANIYTQKTQSGSMTNINKNLSKVLDKYNKNTPEVLSSIVANGGSVQHLKFLTDHEKDVYKTSFEIDQKALVTLACDRSPLIDQAQSLNIFIEPDENGKISPKYLNDIHIGGWKKGLKTFYYLRSKALRSSNKLGIESTRVKLNTKEEPKDEEGCIFCE